MTIELSQAERVLLNKIITSYLSDLRQTIAATKRGTSGMHSEEDMIRHLQLRL